VSSGVRAIWFRNGVSSSYMSRAPSSPFLKRELCGA
jgi:hypothetical protein